MTRQDDGIAVLAAVGLVAAACGGDDDDDDAASDATTAETAADADRRRRRRHRHDGRHRQRPRRPRRPTARPPATPAATETTAGEAVDPASIETDIGVDDTTIKVGMLADLSGAFAPLVTEIVEAQEVYWDKVNDEGGIAGRQVELVIEDNGYDVATQLEKYEALRDEVAIISQSTGSPHTAAIAQSLVDDDLVAIPLSWYSGWADPRDRRRTCSRRYTNYCIESMNGIEWLAKNRDVQTVAIISFPGEYGGDGDAGAAHGRRGARARDRLRRRRSGDPAVGRQPEPRPERGDQPDRRSPTPTSCGPRSTRRRWARSWAAPSARASRACGRATRRRTASSCSAPTWRRCSTSTTSPRPTSSRGAPTCPACRRSSTR